MSQEKKCIISGKVYDAQNQPYPNASLAVSDHKLATAIPIKTATTDADGAYSITLLESELSRNSLEYADISITISHSTVPGVEIISPTYTNLTEALFLDFSFSTKNHIGLSEYEVIAAELAKENYSKIEDINETDIRYYAKSSKTNPSNIASYVLSKEYFRLPNIDQEVVYALLRQGEFNSLASIYSIEEDLLVKLLQDASKRYVIPTDYSDETLAKTKVGATITALSEQLLTADSLFIKIGEKAGITLDDNTKRATYIDLFKNNRKDYTAFLNDVKNEYPTLTDVEKEVDRLFRVSNILDNNIDVLDNFEGLSGTPELWKLSKTEISTDLLDNTITGKYDSVDDYAEIILKRIENSYPTERLQHSLTNNTLKSALGNFIAAHSFRIGKESLTDYTANNDVSGISTTDLKEVEKLDRLYKLAPEFHKTEVIERLDAINIHSALQITCKSSKHFIENYTNDGISTASQAKQIYQRAQHVVNKAIMTYAAKSDNFNNLLPKMMDGSLVEQSTVPSLENLFSSQDYCDCSHCQSMYSPAAYLADLLQFSSNIVKEDGAAVDVAFNLTEHALGIFSDETDQLSEIKSRSDIGLIELSCTNSNTVMPYIDLINEVLEAAILDNDNVATTSDYNRQTTWTEAELNANPEHLQTKVYDDYVSKKLFPWHLPYELWHEEARVYSKHLGTDLLSIEKNFGDTSTPAELKDAEYLGMTPLELAIITKKFLGSDYSINQNLGADYSSDFSGFVLDSYNITTLTGVNIPKLLMEAAEVDLDTLKTIIKSSYIFPNGTPTINTIAPDANPCDLENLNMTVTEADLDRFHRFIRLQKKLGWSYKVLDLALDQLISAPTTDITTDVIKEIAALQRFHKDYKIGIEELLSWTANINTKEFDENESYFKDKFVNKSVNDPISVLEVIFQLNGSELSQDYTSATINDTFNLTGLPNDYTYLPEYIMSACRIRKEDFELLLENESISDINMDNISLVFRISSFCHTIGISITEFYQYKNVVNFTALPSTYQEYVAIETAIDEIRNSSFDVELLDYLINDSENAYSANADDQNTFLVALQESILSENGPMPKPIDGVTEGVYINNLNNFITMVEGGLSSENALNALETNNQITVDERPGILEHYQMLLNGPELIKVFVSEYLSINSKLTTQLINSIPTANDKTFADLVMDNSFIEATDVDFVGGGLFVDLLDMVKTLLQYVTISTNWNLLPEESFVLHHELLLDVNNGMDYEKWNRTSQFVQIQQNSLRKDRSILELINTYASLASSTLEDEKEYRALLENITGFKKDNIATLFPSVPNFDATLLEERIKNIEKCILSFNQLKISKETGASVVQLLDWAGFEFNFEQAKKIKNTAKSKHEYEHWLTIAPDMRNVLREQQRDALLAYIIAYNLGEQFEDAFDVYNAFLIDPAMEACAKTTRIKQAISAIQMLINQTLAGFSSDFKLNADQVEEWKWRKLYRVWEANRKVFLYPENWIEPELRDSKTSFFKELESELMQNDITAESAEDVYLSYLEKLDSIANLEIVQFYEEKFELGTGNDNKYDPNRSVFHVFGRTKSFPHLYYYRQYNPLSGWTAWEATDLSIQGEHIIPYVYNARLYLFWAEFEEAVNDDDIDTMNNSGFAEGETILPGQQVFLNWSQLRKGSWSAPKRSKNAIFYETAQDPSTIFLKAFTDWDGELVVMPMLPIEASYPQPTNKQVSQPAFTFTGCNEMPYIDNRNTWHKNPGYIGTEWKNMKFSRNAENMLMPGVDMEGIELVLLDGLNSGHELTFSHNYTTYQNNEYFFYEDRQRAFFVSRSYTPEVNIWSTENNSNTAAAMVIEDINSNANVNTSMAKVSVNVTQATAGNPGTFNPLGTPDGSPDPFTIPAGSDDNTPAYDAVINPYSTYKFHTFYHPYICLMVKQLRKGGIDALLNPANPDDLDDDSRMILQRAFYKFFAEKDGVYGGDYYPSDLVDTTNPFDDTDNNYPEDAFDFDHQSAYAIYNWELFFHIPMMIAAALNRNKQFEAAQKWYHYIFDPTESEEKYTAFNYPDNNEDIGTSAIQHKWRIKPFNQLAQPASEFSWSAYLTSDETNAAVSLWEDDPFDPHAIAKGRPLAYMKNVVMRYIDNLIEWADMLFARDSIESINEATQLYVLAAQILGRKPEKISKIDNTPIDFYALNELETTEDPDTTGTPLNYITTIENTMVDSTISTTGDGTSGVFLPFYFGIPKNEQLLRYWEKVYDRLFKIRHCMNINGVVRELPIFQPPIDPAMLVKAAAAGIDISQAISDLYAPSQHYRFAYLVQKATEFTADVKALGASLLSAIEKKDAEGMALLRNSHEQNMQKIMLDLRENAVEEAKNQLELLDVSKKMTQTRLDFYTNRIENGIISEENDHLEGMRDARDYTVSAQSLPYISAALRAIPRIEGGTSGGFALIKKTWMSGDKLAMIKGFGTQALNYLGTISNLNANISSILGGYRRREEEWTQQKELAELEIEQIDKQIIAAEIRLAMAEKDLDSLKLQTEQSNEVRNFMENKFSNEKLYIWMSGQLSNLYSASYKMALKLAKKAQKAYQDEMSSTDIIIKGDYWDSLKKGLLAGEKLQKDIRQLEIAYMEENTRRFEMTKHISLAELAPTELLRLRETGTGTLDIPEWVYDLDHPGMYNRRIKSVSVTMPCISGPLHSIPCKVSLTGSDIYGKSGDLVYTPMAAIRSIATSTAQQDSGVFELNFNDSRYLPFEGEGAASNWNFSLPADYRSFDYDSISDVILTIRYTAQDGQALTHSTARIDDALALPNGEMIQVLDLKALFPNEYAEWKKNEDQTIDFNIKKEMLPFFVQDKEVAVTNIDLMVEGKPSDDDANSSNDKLKLGDAPTVVDLSLLTGQEDIFFAQYPTDSGNINTDLGNINTAPITVKIGQLSGFDFDDGLYALINFTITAS